MQELVSTGGDPERVASLSRQIRARIAPFRDVGGLSLRTDPDGGQTLPVTVWTDIQDETFLESFHLGLREAFNESEAARSSRFVVDLEIRRVPVHTLYPEGAPRRGEWIDIKTHAARFPDGALVLTTGAASTHAFQGRAILLGTSPITRRTLAHEFGHLLGFEDAYLRGYEGDPADELGVVLVEWTGLSDDLMGSPGGGRVTDEMIGILIEAYGTNDDCDGRPQRVTPANGSADGGPADQSSGSTSPRDSRRAQSRFPAARSIVGSSSTARSKQGTERW
jgi:hypothetical protein